MDAVETINLHPREVLRQVAASMNWKHNELSVTLPVSTNWKDAIRAAEAALGDINESTILMPPRPLNAHKHVRESALKNVSLLNREDVRHQTGLPIRTEVDLESAGPAPPASDNARAQLKKTAGELMEEGFHEPYATNLRANLAEERLPLVKANISIRGIDADPATPRYPLASAEMIWDTGAHTTVITEDILPAEVLEFLKDPINDPYRSEDGVRLQVDAFVAFTNSLLPLSAVALVVPKSKMPNNRSGILFGQTDCIDHISYRSIPRSIIEAGGEPIADEFWGDIIVDGYLDRDEGVVKL